MNLLDSFISFFSPGSGLERQKARLQLRLYEAAQTPKTGNHRRKSQLADAGSGDYVTQQAGMNLTRIARYLYQNHDLATAIIIDMVDRVVGKGITVEPQVMRLIIDEETGKVVGRELHKEFNAQLKRLRNQWNEKPEVTRELTDTQAQRIACTRWLVDGEMFTQYLEGEVPGLRHASSIPLSYEQLESDMCPMDHEDSGNNIFQGIKKNGWGQATEYYFYKQHPGDPNPQFLNGLVIGSRHDLKAVPAERIEHLKLADRIRQTRGVTVLHAVIKRLENIKDYEEYEQITAKIVAAIGVAIERDKDMAGITAEDLLDGDEALDREFSIAPGMVWDKLLPGEKVNSIAANRPNPELTNFRNAQLKGAVAGSGASYPNVSKDYSSSYSALRQALLDIFMRAEVIQSDFIDAHEKPKHKRVVRAAVTSVLDIPHDVDMTTLFDADYTAPVMPWIDPLKQVNAIIAEIKAGLISRSEAIRRAGRNPDEVRENIKRERAQDEEDGLNFDSAPVLSDEEDSADDESEEQEEELDEAA